MNGPVFWYRKRDGETREDRHRMIEEIARFALMGLGAKTGEAGRKDP